ncbi:MAG: Alkyl hydroperoxide reductase [Candidatus Nomurabacteria bacterium GW2011_GWA1_37_20]|uniref:Alkyl hydroperoxide reductase n=1 Tax=Candidatus Nomurabacteria bacterium GW2011_GWA1_37_20 TaxID=1618729 RepID=A0A0G0JZW9_9BACT|nr:MAG: Alkyl hydroperoxide reductase [Candidatus Nomurabacteria bacterium GW2011_GWA1_37_20]
MVYDLIIIGGGPAGAAAAVYASRKRLQTLFITAEWGGQSVVSEKIYNWIGTTSLSGNELAENFKKHVLANAESGENKSSTLKIKEGEKVNAIEKNDAGFKVKTETSEEFLTKTILITSGSGRRKLVAKNADRLEHKGLTYCASCDGPLFSGMDVAVVGGGNAGFETAAQLLAYCKSVTLLNRSDTFRADEITVLKVLKNPKMKAIKNIDILEVKGDKFVEGIVYKEKATGKKMELKATGIFVEIGQIPNTGFAKEVVPLDEIGRVKIDAWTQKTEILGIWAAGDCTNVLYHQNNIAAGDAIRALEDIYLYIHTK